MLRAVLGAALSVALLASACGGGDDGGSDDSPLLRLLGAIPDTPEAASYVSYTNYQAYYDEFDAGSPPENASSEEFAQWAFSALSPGGDAPPLIGYSEFVINAFNEGQAYQDELGLDPGGIDQAIEAGRPPATYEVLLGDFDAGRIDDAVHTEPNFSGLLEEASYEDMDYYTWGDDFAQDFAHTTPVRNLGRGGRLALVDDRFMWCLWTEGMTGMIDAANDATDSLADREDMRAMAEKLDALGVYSAEFVDPSATETDVQGSVLGPYLSVSTGAGADSGGPFLAVLIANDTAEDASDNATRLESWFTDGSDYRGTVWSDHVDSVGAAAEDTLTVVKLRGGSLPWGILLVNPAFVGGE